MIYLDHAATTPVAPAVLEAAWPWLTSEFGNPSSTHELGLHAHNALENARGKIALWLDCMPSDVIFTSGGTEGDNFALTGLALANPRGKHIISARSEHEAVLGTLAFLEQFHGFEISWLSLDDQGNISLEELDRVLRKDTTLVSLMLVNNEIGTVHPMPEIIQAAHSVGALVHTDAVQAPGWFDIRVGKNGTFVKDVDALTLSGHKFGAPKGSGVTFIRGRLEIEPLLHGGGQEFMKRSGTENVAWAVGLSRAIELLPKTEQSTAHFVAVRDQFIDTVLGSIPEATLTGNPHARHPGIASFTFSGVHGETLLLELEQQHEVFVSSGSACAAGSDDPSHVLIACGVDPAIAQSSVRVSMSYRTTAEEITQASKALVEAVRSIQQRGSQRA